MKLALLFSLLISFSAFADCNREAQFVGTVKNLKTYSTHFTFQVQLGRWFQPSGVCPMWEHELEEAVVKIEGIPAITDGDEISGVMVFDVNAGEYKID